MRRTAPDRALGGPRPAEDRPTRVRLAGLIAELLAPAPIAAALLLVVGWHAAAGGAGLLWGVVAAAFAALLPLAYVLRGVRRGALSDRHVRVRAQRRTPLLIAIASVTAGLLLLALVGAPRDLVALVAAMLVGLTASTAVTLFWKISFHAAVAAGAVVILAHVFGPAWLALAPLVGLVAWSRVASGDHGWAQVAAGAALGGLTAGVVFPLVG